MDRRRAAGIEIEPRGIPAGIHRTVDQSLDADALEFGLAAARGHGFQGRSKFPISGQGDACFHRNLTREVAGRVENEGVPLEQQDVAGDLDGADFGAGGRQIVEIDVDRFHPGCRVQVKRVDIDGIARPGHGRAVRGDLDAREPVDRTFRRMRSRQPLWIEQYGIGADSAQGLMHAHDTPFEIRCVDCETNLAGVRPILRRCDRRRRGDRAWARTCVRRGERGRHAIDRHGHQNLLH